MWPPAVYPSTTNPSTLPSAFFSIVVAKVLDEMIAMKRGRARGGRCRPMTCRGEKAIGDVIVILCPGDVKGVGRRLVAGEAIEHARNLERHTGPHQNVPDAGEHRAIDGGQVRNLDFFQIVDTDGVVVAFACQRHFDEIGHDAQLREFERRVLRVLRQGLYGAVSALPPGM